MHLLKAARCMVAAAEPELPAAEPLAAELPAAEPPAAEPPAVAAASSQEDRSASFAATDRGLDWSRAGGGTVEETFGDETSQRNGHDGHI